ncbi:hypothetical protein B4086_5544 [Bacillus cereus]|nr:hypothetical protein B4086_5544 [Bacillus cereus]
MRTEQFMLGARLNTGKTGLQALIDVMVYRRGTKFFLLGTDVLAEDCSLENVARINLDDFVDVQEAEASAGQMVGYLIDRTWDGRTVTMLGAKYLHEGALLRVTEIDEELLMDEETYEDNIFYARIYTKLTKKQDDTILSPMDEDIDFWDMHDTQAFIDTNLMYFRSLGDLEKGAVDYTEDARNYLSMFAKVLEEDVCQLQLKGILSEILTGLTAEIEVEKLQEAGMKG